MFYLVFKDSFNLSSHESHNKSHELYNRLSISCLIYNRISFFLSTTSNLLICWFSYDQNVHFSALICKRQQIQLALE